MKYFWSQSSPACHASMPHLHRLRDEYGPKGLKVVSVHRPMGEFDLDEAAVRKLATELGITEELLFDNDHKLGDELGVDAWPTYFLFDSNGKLRRHTKGNFGVRMIEQALIRLFTEDSDADAEKSIAPTVTESFPLSF